MAKSVNQIVVFVEGDTEKEFFDALVKFYRANSKNTLHEIRIFNVRGISRFESIVISKLKHDIIPKINASNIIVVCCYDTDVFELAQKPPVNWVVLKKNVIGLGIKKFIEVKERRMLEDWFLKDIKGLCKFLKISEPKRIEGKDGLDKVKKLFKRGDKIYVKGLATAKFIPALNIKLIRDSVKTELLEFEEAINAHVN